MQKNAFEEIALEVREAATNDLWHIIRFSILTTEVSTFRYVTARAELNRRGFVL